MIERIRTLIRESWNRGTDFLYVFPSEIVATLWAKDCARHGERGTVAIDRFISWDSFKEKYFRGDEERRPANTLVRTLFVQSFLQQHSSHLRRLGNLGMGGDNTGFVNTLVPQLPTLGLLWGPRFREQLPALLQTGDPELWADYRILIESYRDFLQEHNYYEPGWLDKDPVTTTGQGFVFFPELLDDWAEFEPGVRKIVGVVPVSLQPSQKVPSLFVYPNAAEEVGALFDWIEAYLEKGIPPGEILLSLAGYDDLLPLVEREARRRSIPLEGRKGRSLLDFRGPGLFVLVQETRDSTYEALEALFLSPGLPLLPDVRSLGRKLLRLAIDKNAAFGNDETWAWVLGSSDLGAFYKKFKETVHLLFRAKNFADLRLAIEQVLGFLVGPSAPWNPEDLGALQRARELVKSLEETQVSLGLPIANPFGLWLNQMQSSQYVPQGKNGVIEVYPYRVGAGVPGKVHGILNLSQEDTTVVTGGFSFLRDDQLEMLGAGYRIMSEDFLRAYRESGDFLWLSASSTNPSGARIPALSFQNLGGQKPFRWKGPIRDYSLYRWAGPGVDYFNGVSAVGNRSNLQVWTRTQLTPRLAGEHQNKDGYVYISARQIKQASSCLLEYIVDHGLKVRDRQWKPELDSPLVEGNLYHTILEIILNSDEDLSETLEKVARRYYPPTQRAYMIEKVLTNIGVILQAIDSELGTYKTWGQEQEWVRVFHRPFPLGNKKTALSGRIDWLAEIPGVQDSGLAIIDFKRTVGATHKPRAIAKAIRKGIFDSSEDGDADDENDLNDDNEEDTRNSSTTVETQLLTYSLLVSPSTELGMGELLLPQSPRPEGALPAGGIIRNLAYIQLSERGKYKTPTLELQSSKRIHHIYTAQGEKGDIKGLRGPEELAQAQGQIILGAERLLKAIEAGNFPPSADGCPNCRWRGICRTKFVMNLEGGGRG